MLAKKDNPPMIGPSLESISAASGRWWVAHCKSRFEKAFAWDMLNGGTACFLPMVERITISGGKKRHIMKPLFPSYVFFCGTEDDRYRAMTTNRLCQTIDVPDQEELVSQLSNLLLALKGQAPLDPYPHAVVGNRCRVTAGPFMGLEGTVVDRPKLARIVLEVGILGQAAVMEVDADLLEPLE